VDYATHQTRALAERTCCIGKEVGVVPPYPPTWLSDESQGRSANFADLVCEKRDRNDFHFRLPDPCLHG